MKPLLSIITPVVNTEAYLRECIDSCLSQTMPELDRICINDGSTDGSLAILQGYAARDSRVRVLSQENCGYAKSANRGIREAQGEWIMFVDSDDLLESDACEVLLNAARESEANAVAADFFLFSGAKENRLELAKQKMAGRPDLENRILPDPAVLYYYGYPSMWSALYSKELLLQEQIFCDEETKTFSDNSFCFSLVANPKTKLYYLPRPLYHWRQDCVAASNWDSGRGGKIIFAMERIGEWLRKSGHTQNQFLMDAFYRLSFVFHLNILHQQAQAFLEHIDVIQKNAQAMRSSPGFGKIPLGLAWHKEALDGIANDARGFFERWCDSIDFAKNHQKIVLLGKRPAVLEMGGRLAGLGYYEKIVAYAFPDGEEQDPLFPLRLAMVRLEERPLWRAEQVEELTDGAFVKNC
jgi:glycosyltransferase involved in cell wall biosynthesis